MMPPEAFDPYHKWLGISSQENPPNHYRLLGLVLFEDDRDVIQNAADRQMLHVKSMAAGKHAAVAQQILNELSAARVCLLVPETKQAYDKQLRGKLAAAKRATPLPETVLPPPVAAPPVESAPLFVPSAPKPQQQPVAVTAWTPPVAAATTPRIHPKRKQSTAALATSAVCIVAIFGIGLCMFLLRDQLFANPEPVAKKTKRSANKSLVAAVNAEANPAEENPADSAPSLMATTNAMLPTERARTEPTVDPELIRTHLWEARKALAQRNQSAAESRLTKAAALVGNVSPETAEELKADLEHWRQVQTNLASFWQGVRDAIDGKLPPGQSHIVGDDEVRMLGRQDGIVTYQLNGSQSLGEVNDLPSRVAVVLASKGLEGEPSGDAAVATFVLIDSKAVADGLARSVAEELQTQIASRGAADPTVQRLLDEAPLEAQRAATELLAPDVDALMRSRPTSPSAMEDLAVVDPLELVDRAAIRAAKSRLRADHQQRLTKAQGDPTEAKTLIRDLNDAAEQSPDEASRCAHLELALEVASSACLSDEIAGLAEAFASASGQNPDVLKHFFLARCKPRTVPEATKLYEEAHALMERAELLREYGLAIKFWEVAATAADRTKNLALQRGLIEKRTKLQAALDGRG